MIRLLNMIMVMLAFCECAMAQQPVKEKPGKLLTVGDRVPDVYISRIINDKNTSARLSDYKDKLLILDFWATTCKGCVAALPRMESLQQQFGNRLKILPVTYEQEEPVRAFLKKNRYTKDLSIPSVVEDKVLAAHFRHRTVPHEVWIYRGRIAAITLSDYVNEENIRWVLDGKNNNWPVKNDFIPVPNLKRPLLVAAPGQRMEENAPARYVALFGFREGIGYRQGTVYDSTRKVRRNYIINSTIPMAYIVNWHKLRDSTGQQPLSFPDPTRIILEVKDKRKYLNIVEGEYLAEWQRRNLFCYEASFPDDSLQSPQEQSRSVIADLDYLLGLHGRYETRKMNCLVLVRNGNEDRLKTKGGERQEELHLPVKKLQNAPLNTIVWEMNQHHENPPIFDETGYNEMVDMEIHADSWTDIPAIRRDLQNYGLDLRTEQRELEMFVLTETK